MSMLPNVPIASMFLAAKRTMDTASMLQVYRQDNEGYLWLKSNFPHLVTQLDDLTLDWLLLPKSVVRSCELLQSSVKIYRKNMEFGVPSYLPDSITPTQFRDMMGKALDFLTGDILPVLSKKERGEFASA